MSTFPTAFLESEVHKKYMKLHLIMPMGGGGTRFGNRGFGVPKPLIEIYGRPFFYWAAQSIAKTVSLADLTFVVLQEHIDRFGIDRAILQYYPEAHIRVLPKVLNGAVLTCMEGCRELPVGEPILFNDCDHLFRCESFYEFCRAEAFEGMDGALLTFCSDDPKYSYAAYDEKGCVTRTVEKQVISRDAICGAYYFRSREVFEEAAAEYLEKCNYSEYFVSGVYNIMAGHGLCVKTFAVDSHVSFGTPEEYEEAQADTTYRELV